MTPAQVLLGLEQHPQLRRAVQIEPATVVRIVRAFPTAATPASKHDDETRNAVIADQLGMSVRTVQHARRLLRLLLEAEAA